MRTTYIKYSFPVILMLFSCAAVAQSTVNIDGGAKFVMTGNVNMVINGGTNLKTVASQIKINGGTLIITGINQGTGSISSSPTSSLIIGSTGGTLNFDQSTGVTRSLKNLTLNSSATLTLGNALDITAGATPGTVIVNNGATLTTNGNLTIKSDAAGTARVGISAGTISGDVTVERYINAATVGRKWHLLSGVATTGAQNIVNSWQETGGTPTVANLGTWITSNGYNGSNGYDATSVSGSILKHNPAGPTPSWESLAATNSGPISSEQGYMLFVRGDRFSQPANSLQNNTVLRTKGSLKQGTQTAIPILQSSPGYTMIGNPFASAIDLEDILNRTTDLDNNFLIWDASEAGNYSVGKYRAVQKTGAGTYIATPVSANDNSLRYIHSGQAFFLRTTTSNTNNASLQIVEADKTASLSVVNPLTPVPGDQQIYTELVTINPGNIESVADALRVWYNAGFDEGTSDDIIKLGNFGENISSFREGKKLIVEMRPMISSKDTIFLRTSNLGIKNYILKINTFDFVQLNVKAFLKDNYLNNSSPVDLNGTVNNLSFSVTSDPASASPDRFMIVFASNGTLPVTFTNVEAKQQGQAVAVSWKVNYQLNVEKYEVEKSTDGNSFSNANIQQRTGANGSDAAYNWLDLKPVFGNNYYRIRSISLNGGSKTSQVVKIWMGNGNPVITVYPNPVTNRNMTLQFSDMVSGIYQLRLMNNLGQVLLTKTITHSGGSAAQTVMLDKNIAAGNYQLEILKPDKTKTTKTIQVAD